MEAWGWRKRICSAYAFAKMSRTHDASSASSGTQRVLTSKTSTTHLHFHCTQHIRCTNTLYHPNIVRHFSNTVHLHNFTRCAQLPNKYFTVTFYMGRTKRQAQTLIQYTSTKAGIQRRGRVCAANYTGPITPPCCYQRGDALNPVS